MASLVFKTPLTKNDNEKLKDQFSKIVCQRLKILREKSGLTQQELSDKAGLHLTYVGHLELGKYHPSTFVLWKIAQVLKISLDSLTSDSD